MKQKVLLIVRYICEDYCIDLPPELQDQQALNASPLRDIIIRTWKEEIHREVDADNWRRCARQPGKLTTTTREGDGVTRALRGNAFESEKVRE